MPGLVTGITRKTLGEGEATPTAAARVVRERDEARRDAEVLRAWAAERTSRGVVDQILAERALPEGAR